MRVIRGTTVEEQIASIDAYLHRTRGLLYNRQMHALLVPHGVSAYAKTAIEEEEFGHAMIPMAGTFSKVILQVDDIPRIPLDVKEPFVVVSVIVEVDGTNWVEVRVPVQANKRAQVSAQNLKIGEGTRIKFATSRLAHGVWICCIVEPKPYPVSVELPNEGI